MVQTHMRALLLLFGPALAAGAAGFLVSVNAQGGAPQFAYDQQHPTAVEAAPLAHAVSLGREPVAAGNGAPAVRARCRPGGAGQLRNPWTCSVLYASGHTIRYVLTVNADGTFHGSDSSGSATIDGHMRAVGLGGG